MDLEEIIKSSDLFESKKLKIKINSSNKFRTYNQIESIFRAYIKNSSVFTFQGDYASTTIGITYFDRTYNEICKIGEKPDHFYFKFPNENSKGIFKEVMSSFYSL